VCGLVLLARSEGRIDETNRRAGRRMLERLAKRGPDGAGEWVDPESRVYLGHRRLAVIDLDDGAAQPFHWPEAGLSLVYNGELYNWRRLRVELEGRGHRFRTESDSEVLIHAYGEWGQDALQRLRGMYAFAIWDEKSQTAFLARDPYGIKPLYYSWDGQTFQVASQVRALIEGDDMDRAPDPAGWAGFLLWGSVPEPWTVYRGIRALPAGSTLRWTPKGLDPPHSFADLEEALSRPVAPEDSERSTERIRQAFRDSVSAHLVADVPVGAFLSGGIDSGALVGLMRDLGAGDLRTVTLGFEEFRGKPEDEVPWAERVSRLYGTHHTTRIIGRKEFLEDWPRIQEAMDQPSVDGANTWLVSKVAQEAGLKVVISGVGGDELLGGYPSFREIPRWVRTLRRIRAIPLAAQSGYLLTRLARRACPAIPPKLPGLFRYGHTMAGAYFVRRGLFMPWELEDLLDPDFARAGLEALAPLPWQIEDTDGRSLTPLGRVMALESTRYLRNQLLRDADWASMDHGLELRTPLVDACLLSEIGPCLAARSTPDKIPLAVAPTRALPQNYLERPKTGFGLPLENWLCAALPGSPRSDAGNRARMARVQARALADDVGQLRAGQPQTGGLGGA